LDFILVFFRLIVSFAAISGFLLVFITSANAAANQKVSEKATLRIITLSPHLTEIVYALGKGDQVVAVSDYSDYPTDAASLPSVASYEGANIAEIIRLQPTHILVWRGGNKDADIEKLSQLDIILHESSIDSVEELMSDVLKIGDVLNAQKEASALVESMQLARDAIASRHENKSVNAVYYLSTQPLIGLGNDKWLNSLLNLCGISNIYASSKSAYPQLQMSHIIRSQPALLIAATNEIAKTWQPHQAVLKAKIVSANPDALHRFTPRAIDEMSVV